jgi:hypothetical protein
MYQPLRGAGAVLATNQFEWSKSSDIGFHPVRVEKHGKNTMNFTK